MSFKSHWSFQLKNFHVLFPPLDQVSDCFHVVDSFDHIDVVKLVQLQHNGAAAGDFDVAELHCCGGFCRFALLKGADRIGLANSAEHYLQALLGVCAGRWVMPCLGCPGGQGMCLRDSQAAGFF